MINLRLGQEVTLNVQTVTSQGEGICRYDGFVVFVPYSTPGDVIRVQITETKSNFARGQILSVVTPSPSRVDPACASFPECGGCTWLHVKYPEQVRLKTDIVRDAVKRIAKLDESLVKDTLPSDRPWFYRNKAMLPISRVDGKIAIGCYARGTHRVIDASICRIQHPLNNKVISALRPLLEKYNLTPYDEATGKGLLRHILSRVSSTTNKGMVTLVANAKHLPNEERIARELMKAVPEVIGVALNVNTERTNVVLGQETRIIAGNAGLRDSILGLDFQISATSFAQVNPQQAKALYQKVLEYADLRNTDVAIDIYSGIGIIALLMAKKAREVYGIEISNEAVKDARQNARVNDIKNAVFLGGDASIVLEELRKRHLKPDVVVVDPPRRGCSQKLLETITAMKPQRFIYVSCNPATLARDLGLLSKLNYRVQEIQPIDMFPQTHHVECVALLTN